MNLLSSVFVNKKFAPFFWVQFLGAMNDNIIKNLLVILIAYKGIELYGLNSQTLIALVGAIFILPYVLFSPYAGLLSDKYNKVQVIRITKYVELFIMLLATFGFYNSNYLVLIISVFLMGVQSTFFGPVKFSIIPNLVENKNLSVATSYVEFGTFLAILIGTICGGMLSKVSSWQLYGVVLCSVSILGIFLSIMQPLKKENGEKIEIGYNIFGGHLKLFKILSGQWKVFNIVILISCFWFFGAGLLTVLPTFCQKILLVDESVVTLFLAMFTFGIGAGSLLSGYLSGHKVQLGLVPFGAIGVLIFTFDFYFYNNSLSIHSDQLRNLTTFLVDKSSYRSLFDFFMISFSGGVYIVPLYAYVQDQAKNGTLSRVIAINNVMNALFMVVVSLIIIYLTKTGKTSIEALMATATIFIFLFFIFYFKRKEFRTSFMNYILRR